MAWTERYVTTTATGSGDGTSGNPWTLTQALANAVAGDRVNIKAGTYANTTTNLTTTNSGTATNLIVYRGYATTIGDLDNVKTGRPLISFTTGQFSVGTSFLEFRDLEVTSANTSYAFNLTGAATNCCFTNCKIRNTSTTTGGALNWSGGGTILANSDFSTATATTTQECVNAGSSGWRIEYCLFSAAGYGLQCTESAGNVLDCIFTGCSRGFSAYYISMNVIRCVFYNCGYGIYCLVAPTQRSFFANNLFSTIATEAIHLPAASPNPFYMVRIANAFWNAASTESVNFGDSYPLTPNILLTADPFVNAAGGDFNLNNVAGGGALLRAASYNI